MKTLQENLSIIKDFSLKNEKQANIMRQLVQTANCFGTEQPSVTITANNFITANFTNYEKNVKLFMVVISDTQIKIELNFSKEFIDRVKCTSDIKNAFGFIKLYDMLIKK